MLARCGLVVSTWFYMYSCCPRRWFGDVRSALLRAGCFGLVFVFVLPCCLTNIFVFLGTSFPPLRSFAHFLSIFHSCIFLISDCSFLSCLQVVWCAGMLTSRLRIHCVWHCMQKNLAVFANVLPQRPSLQEEPPALTQAVLQLDGCKDQFNVKNTHVWHSSGDSNSSAGISSPT